MKKALKVSMDWVVLLVLPIIFPTCASGLFTVEVDKNTYKSAFREDVVMGCSFQPLSPTPPASIKVTWHWIAPSGQVQEVYRMDNGVEQLSSQHPDYQGRAKLLTDELQRGWAKLQVSELRINDSGTYQCYVQTAAGADYKTMTLSVFAPFKTIDKSFEKVPERGEVLLTCQSEGYPQPEVTWHDGHHRDIKPTTTTETTVDRLFKITTQINVTSSDKNNYTCNFTDHTATFNIPEDIPAPADKKHIFIVSLCLAATLAAIIVIFGVCKCQQKGLRTASTRNLLVDTLGRALAFPTGNQKDSINDEEKTIMNQTTDNGCPRSLLKDHYSEWIKTLGRSHWDVDELCSRLYNNDAQQLHLQDLVPADGEVLLLEGPAGSGKTTLAHMLVFSWAQQSVQPASDLPDLSHLQLIIYVDGDSAKCDLFHEITSQLSLNEDVLKENDLRNLLTYGTLLIVDGYKEGNQIFDESLQRFLFDHGGCRALIMTGPGHSLKVKEMVGTRAIVTLQMQSQRY